MRHDYWSIYFYRMCLLQKDIRCDTCAIILRFPKVKSEVIGAERTESDKKALKFWLLVHLHSCVHCHQRKRL